MGRWTSSKISVSTQTILSYTQNRTQVAFMPHQLANRLLPFLFLLLGRWWLQWLHCCWCFWLGMNHKQNVKCATCVIQGADFTVGSNDIRQPPPNGPVIMGNRFHGLIGLPLLIMPHLQLILCFLSVVSN